MWEARHKTVFVVRSELITEELGLKCIKAFLLLLTDQAWFVSTLCAEQGFDHSKGNKAYKMVL